MSSTRTWLRAFVLLLALLVPAAPAGAHAATAVTPVVSGEITEYDVLDTALRPAARHSVAPLRPAPRVEPPSPVVPEGTPLPAPPHPSYRLLTLRTVVLRC
ncbi:hypothetical protein [Streptomyces justiciae]|uniref:hypothetical protein n=1 Tax=Streptomyces justiciae TaxID=2780140 RepID=UPI001882D26D|nr:hypothetical protein [Streptomyces justiciae]MBE8471674.1 hypothetical protein [Streptomyces justiciae]MCW8383370.1 hypothetical protein [Streptomyces justiciae]